MPRQARTGGSNLLKHFTPYPWRSSRRLGRRFVTCSRVVSVVRLYVRFCVSGRRWPRFRSRGSRLALQFVSDRRRSIISDTARFRLSFFFFFYVQLSKAYTHAPSVDAAPVKSSRQFVVLRCGHTRECTYSNSRAGDCHELKLNERQAYVFARPPRRLLKIITVKTILFIVQQCCKYVYN